MKLTRLRLENYIGIYSGLNLTEIEIDFTLCRHNILMIIGDNASGKSTIIRALNPLPDSSSSFISGKSARKIIGYIDNDGTMYEIEYVHSIGSNGKRETTKGFIRKTICGEVVELNPNGNVSSCKDILFTELGLDSNFVSLSEIGCENRGIATKKPAERKQYVNYILNNLEAYNNIHKTLNKRSSIFKSMINSITTKLSNLGDPEMINGTLVSLNNRINNINSERDSLLSMVSESKAKISLLDPDGSIQAKAKDIIKNLNDYELEESKISESLSNISMDKNTVESMIADMKSESIRHETIIESINEKNTYLMDQMESKSKDIISKQSKLNNLNSDEHYTSILEEYNTLKTDIEKYDVTISNMGLTNSDITSAELVASVNMIMSIKDAIYALKDKFDYSTTQIVLSGDYESLSKYETIVYNLQSELDSINMEINSIESKLSILDILDKRPSECSIDNCPFISKAVELSSLGLNEKYDALLSDKERIENQINVNLNTISNLKIIEECKSYVDSIINVIKPIRDILIKLPGGEVFIDENELFNKLFKGIDFKEIEILYSYLDIANVLDLNKDAKSRMNILENELKGYEYKKQIINEIVNDIKNINNDLNKLTTDIDVHKQEISEHEKRKTELDEQILAFSKVLSSLIRMEEIHSNIDDLKKTYSKIESDIKSINEFVSIIYNGENQIRILDSNLTPMLDERDKLVHSLNLIKEYNEELQEYTAKHDKIETIKYYSSPTSGIQLIFLSLYMNKILSIANDLLGLMFGGEIEILPFIINEKEFRIPCSTGGLPTDDITSMSNSQICMVSTVIQFSLLYQSSTKLNIPRLDEIDSGLDTFNRSQFVNFLRELLYKLSIDQAIIISHNNEIMNSDADIIVLRNNGKKEINGNVIYHY
jgi:energy-coupling factor transporter ATP-binding protein EcfA2